MNKLDETAPQESRLRTVFRALRHRNFRYFYMGQTVSLTGTWMQRVAMGWLVYRLTESAFLLGLVGFTSQIPTLLLSPFAGVVADRFSRHRLTIITQALAMLQAFTLATLVFTDLVQVWHVIVLSGFLGVINAFDMPIRQSFMVEMIEDRRDLGNAIALNSSMVNAARLLGPSTAGLLIAAVGEGICFLLNGLSYIAVIGSLMAMTIPPSQPRQRTTRVWHELREGLQYAGRFEPIRAILLMLGLVGFAGMPYTVLLPIFARDILKGGPDTLGFLMGAAGIGALFGAVYLASRKTVFGMGKLIPIASAVFGLSLMVFSFSEMLAISLALMFLTGLGQMIEMATSNTLLQTIVDDDKRGRIMSLYTIAIMGMAPIGSFIAGSLASSIGAPWTVFIGGSACVIGSYFFARRLPILREKVLPVYRQRGIVPEIARGLQGATEPPAPGPYPQ